MTRSPTKTNHTHHTQHPCAEQRRGVQTELTMVATWLTLVAVVVVVAAAVAVFSVVHVRRGRGTRTVCRDGTVVMAVPACEDGVLHHPHPLAMMVAALVTVRVVVCGVWYVCVV